MFVGKLPVCSINGWTMAEAEIVCRQLGYPVVKATRDSAFGTIPSESTAIRALAYFSCNGTEDTLLACPHNTTTSCREGQAAGVVCSAASFYGRAPAASVLDCQQHCQASPGCNYFSFNTTTLACDYTSQRRPGRPRPGTVSGPKTCSLAARCKCKVKGAECGGGGGPSATRRPPPEASGSGTTDQPVSAGQVRGNHHSLELYLWWI